nr:sigma-E factor negative regulatory protein [Ramlibacter sp. 2FC]
MNEVLMRREQMSALADGQLNGGEFADAVEAATLDADARESWHLYHLVGDVLRSSELAACGHDRGFASRLSQRLQAEALPRPTAPHGPQPGPLFAHSAEAADEQRSWRAGRPAANASLLRWKLAAGVASLAALGTLSWSLLGGLGQGPQGGQLAQLVPAPGATLVALPGAQPARMIRDPRLDELLAAHRQLGGASALQNSSGFLRNATFEGAER